MTNMTKENDTLRERLLSHLPEPTNLNAYREEIDQMLKKQEKSLSTFIWTSRVLSLCTLVLAFTAVHFYTRHNPLFLNFLVLAGVFFLVVLSEKPMPEARRQYIDLLKEIKQVQVQLLELQLQINNKTHV